MKNRIFLFTLLLISLKYQAQVEVTNGPELPNEKIEKMNRLMEGEDGNFYAYRVRTKGKGTSYFVEKYDKNKMNQIFSKEIIQENDKSRIEDVMYSGSTVFIFRRDYVKENQHMTLSYQTVSSTGLVAAESKDIVTITSDHYQFIDFDIYQNPARTKFLVKACYKADKGDAWKTDLLLLDGKTMKQSWKKTVNERLIAVSKLSGLTNMWTYAPPPTGMSMTTRTNPEREDLGLVGMILDDNDNVYYGFSSDGKNSKEEERHYKLTLYSLEVSSNLPKALELVFPTDYFVRDLMITKTDKELVVGGFVKDVLDRNWRGKEKLIQCGVFSFKVDPTTNMIKAKALKIFDDDLLEALGSKAKDRDLRYKMDYTFQIGSDIFFVGEEYKETLVRTTSNYGTPGIGTPRMGTTSTSSHWEYEYRDVIVSKLNGKGEFEWIRNSPMENSMTLGSAHIFKEYIAFVSGSSIYVLCNENPKNMKMYDEPKFDNNNMHSMSGIHGSNFVGSTISLKDAQFKHFLIFKNEDFCFAPVQEKDKNFMPPEGCENFVRGKNNEILIYTEDRGLGRLSRLIFK